MTTKQIRNSLILTLTAFIWGVAFVAQTTGGNTIGPYSFNCIRLLIGSLVLLPVICFLDKKNLSPRKPVTSSDRKTLWTGGTLSGIALCLASNVQQLGLFYGTPAGKAGFLTTCYILLVPIIGIFLKKKCGFNVWFGVVITLIGLYLLCINERFALQFSDGLVLICALIFSFHILIIDYYSPLVDGVRMSCIQFFISGLLSAIPMFFIEMKHSINGIMQWFPSFATLDAWIPLLYAGVMSCGVAYTLQIIGQKGLNPTIASLIMSLESVFSVIAGAILLNQQLKPRELLGCTLIFIAIVLAQLPTKQKSKL